MIKKGDKVRHKDEGLTGTAAGYESNGTVAVEQDKGGTAIWVALDTEVIVTFPSSSDIVPKLL
jgi:hypothetical protein